MHGKFAVKGREVQGCLAMERGECTRHDEFFFWAVPLSPPGGPRRAQLKIKNAKTRNHKNQKSQFAEI